MQESGMREEEVEKSLGELYEHYDEIMHKLWTILNYPPPVSSVMAGV